MSDHYELEVRFTNAAGATAIDHYEMAATAAPTPEDAAGMLRAVLKVAPTAGSGKISHIAEEA